MTTKKIVLATVNARYSHTSLALRCLLANLGEFQARTTLLEFTLQERPSDMLERVLECDPDVVGLSVSVWNVAQTSVLATMLKAVRPRIVLVVGGPEVWFEQEDLDVCRVADHIVVGEGEVAFHDLVAGLESGAQPPRIIQASPLRLDQVRLPCDLYTDADLRHRLIYVETSRGCPYRCAFCLSSVEPRVRWFPSGPVLDAVARLMDRGASSLKFVDRTMNVNPKRFVALLDRCLAHHQAGSALHFEVVPVPLPDPVLERLARFPPGAVQLEVGIQTFTPAVAAEVSRNLNPDRIERFLSEVRARTGVHLHTDLIFGLPGETLETFAHGFDRLLSLEPHEVQVGILKRLRGTPLTRRPSARSLRFNPNAPYEVLETDRVPFEEMQRVKRFARYFDLYYNSGEFVASMTVLLGRGGVGSFERFMAFSDWLFDQTGRTHGLALVRRHRLLFAYLTEVLDHPPRRVAEALQEDYDRHIVRRERLEFLRPYLGSVAPRRVLEPGLGVRTSRGRGRARTRST